MVDIEIPILRDHAQSPFVLFHGRGSSCTEILCVYRTALEKKLLLVTLFLSITMVGLVIGIAVVHGKSHSVKISETPNKTLHPLPILRRSQESSIGPRATIFASSTTKRPKIEKGHTNSSPIPEIIKVQNDTNSIAVVPNTSTVKSIITTTEASMPIIFSAIEPSGTILFSTSMPTQTHQPPTSISSVESLNITLDVANSTAYHAMGTTKVDSNSTKIS